MTVEITNICKIHNMKISGKLIDIHKREIYPAVISIVNGRIDTIERVTEAEDTYIMPGLIDAHIHIESSMVSPGSFAAAAVSRGTTGVVSDPHEIANVLGTEGVKYMMEDAGKVPLKFWFGAPSCVPATSFESSGASLGPDDVDILLQMPEVKYLSEMMNFPGVINDNADVKRKIESAINKGKPVDGHAPGLTGADLKKYIDAGISTDHECSSSEEAREKIMRGMKILIREGSAARNLNALKDLFRTDPENIMLCSDDLHPEMLMKRHIDKIVAELISDGYNIFDVIRSCTLNPVSHYSLNAGLLRPGDPADLIRVGDYRLMDVLETWIDGNKVYDRGSSLFYYHGALHINHFNATPVSAGELVIKREGTEMRVIQAFDGELYTKDIVVDATHDDTVKSDTGSDILKIVVKDRYRDMPPAAAFIRGFGLKQGAFASSVAHDSHNIICIGVNDDDIVLAINEIIKMKGGLAVVNGGITESLALPVAGIMSDEPVATVAVRYEALSSVVKSMGCGLSAPFMTLSFMALLVIPELKISDKGLFDVNKFALVSLFI
jgi:adenine deaminase